MALRDVTARLPLRNGRYSHCQRNSDQDTHTEFHHRLLQVTDPAHRIVQAVGAFSHAAASGTTGC